MRAIYEQYTDELSDEFNYLATWLPGTQIRLGDVGRLQRDRFEFVTTLADMGIPFTVRAFGGPTDYQYVSARGADIAFDASAQATEAVGAPATGAAKVSVLFKRANAIVFVAAGCTTSLLDNQHDLGTQLIQRHQAGSFPKDYVVVTELVTAASATILISASDSARMDIAASAQLAPTGISLADASAGLKVVSSSGIATQILSQTSLTPLFRASAVRRRLLGGATFQARSPGTREVMVSEGEAFVSLTYDDIDDGL